MTMTAISTKQFFDGNASATTFSFSFKVRNADHIEVWFKNTSDVWDSAALVKDTDYTVALNNDGTGTVTYPITGDALAVDEQLFIRLAAPYDQLTDLTNQGPYNPETLERDTFDQIVRQTQQLDERAGRSLRQPLHEGTLDMGIPNVAARAGKYLGFGATGLPVALEPTGTSPTLADLSANTGSGLIGHINGGTGAVTRTVQTRLRDFVNVADFGNNTTPGTTDMTAAWQAAVNASDHVLYMEDTLVTDQIDVPSGTTIIGIGSRPKVSFSGSMVADNLFDCSSNSDISFKNVHLVGDQTADAGSTILGHGIFANGGSRIYVDDARIEGFPQSGVTLREVTDGRVALVEVDDIQPATSAPGSIAGINVEDDSTRILIFGCTVSNIGLNTGGIGHGIRVIAQNAGNGAPTKVRIVANHCEDIQQHGILYYDNIGTGTDALGSSIFGNTTERTGLSALGSNELGNGIYVVNISNVSIGPNNVTDAQVNTVGTTLARAGIAIVAEAGKTSTSISITGGCVKDSGNHGIQISGVDGFTITGISIDAWTDVGIRLTDCANFSIGGITYLNNNTTEIFECTGTASNGHVDLRAAPDRSGNEEPFIRNNPDGCYVTTTGTALPDAGTWSVGDIVYLREPAAGESRGWVCTASGTPGTWVPFGTVSVGDLTATADDATPTVLGARVLLIPANTGATAITQLDDAVAGQIVTVIATSATNPPTMADSGNFKLSAAWAPGVDDNITLHTVDGTNWREIGRVDN